MALQGNLPVIPTPFENGTIEYAGFDRLIERTIDYLDGYVVCGSTGESPAMTTQERISVIQYVQRRLPKEKEAVVGLNHTSLSDAVEIGRAAAEVGVKNALVPSPFYFPNGFSMVVEYIGELADKTGLNIVFYDNPVTTKTTFTADQLQALAKAVPNVVAVKMTDHNMRKIITLKENTPLKVFGGDDIICFRAFEAGVDGSMIIAPIIYPEAFDKCWRAYRSGNRELSFDIFSKVILPFIHMFGPGDEIPTTKALFKHLGIFASAETRLPLLAADERRIQEVLLGYEQGLKSGHHP